MAWHNGAGADLAAAAAKLSRAVKALQRLEARNATIQAQALKEAHLRAQALTMTTTKLKDSDE